VAAVLPVLMAAVLASPPPPPRAGGTSCRPISNNNEDINRLNPTTVSTPVAVSGAQHGSLEDQHVESPLRYFTLKRRFPSWHAS